MILTESLFLLFSTYGLIMNTGALKFILNTPSIDTGPRLATRGSIGIIGIFRGAVLLVLLGMITPGNFHFWS